MEFLVPNYSCLQNPWLGGYRPQIHVLSVLCPQLNLLNPPPRKKFLGTPLVCLFWFLWFVATVMIIFSLIEFFNVKVSLFFIFLTPLCVFPKFWWLVCSLLFLLLLFIYFSFFIIIIFVLLKWVGIYFWLWFDFSWSYFTATQQFYVCFLVQMQYLCQWPSLTSVLQNWRH